ncbi:MAG: preprotein translocase subunit SecA [Myxococcales bacterium]|nr:preprotein translocase subunit SecA [Myxococcales bacterium]USN51885.1 MAG: preprotein translocase subunit SecA [Myxococcales bacterium]
MGIFSKIFGSKNDREVRALGPIVQAVNSLENETHQKSDQQLLETIQTLKENISKEVLAMEKNNSAPKRDDYNKILDPVLPKVFATVREAGMRVLNMRHYDVQLIGGINLHRGRISEMKTGEGKTLVATLPLVLNSLCGKGAHLVTVNDYLASRDAEWMGRIYRFLGLSVGVVVPQTGENAKKEAYLADITYGQNNEFGFDYLRDNMKFNLRDYVQRDHFFAVVDEVDSILIDEARTPLIISGPSEQSTSTYQVANEVVPKLRKDSDFSIDEKSRAVMLTESGIEKSEKLLNINNLYDPANIEYLHHLNQSLRAHSLFKRDVDYVIEKGEVIIVDEHTGRLMHGRRWSDGLHQAIEAKENVRVQAENQTLATITFQNYFRMYKKLSGMTGTADTEAEEFAQIYDLDVLVIPTNKSLQRIDEQDLIYKTEAEKFKAVATDIEKSHQKGQPVLVGTVSVEKSEIISRWLKKLNIPFHVLNAKKHRDEAAIVAQAGRLGAVTIATNMAGRGTDIILGGDPEFMARSKVAQAMHETTEQIAQFAFLTGRPDLINTRNLAQRDSHERMYIAELDQRINQLKEEGKDPSKEGLPTTLEEAQKLIFEERKAFYDKAVELYTHELEKSTAICRDEKSKVLEVGGLRIIGTERHESRRIDNQLRGRAGRQGDPGSSVFYLSLQDDLMRIFGSDRMIGMMERLGMEDDVPIEHPWVTRSIKNAQKRVEGFHFDSRKQLIEYDDVMNQQRNTIYGLRRHVLEGHGIREMIYDLVEQAIVNLVNMAAPEKIAPSEWKLNQLEKDLAQLFGLHIDLSSSVNGDRDELMDYIFGAISKFYDDKENNLGQSLIRQIEHFVYLQTIDRRWKEHLQAMDHLREGIHFRGYAQKDPKQEYKKEGFYLFSNMMSFIRDEVIEKVFKVEIKQESSDKARQEMEALEAKQQEMAKKMQNRQVFGRGQSGNNANKKPTASAIDGEDADASSDDRKLNRHQRRAMKKYEKSGARRG